MGTVQVLDQVGSMVDVTTLARLAELPASAISDSLDRDPGAQGLVRIGATSAEATRSMVGVALTVRTRPGDNLAVHVALDLARPGDVLVIDGAADLRNALLGELIATYALTKGLAGIVVDGSVRDSEDLRRLDLPIYARGVTHRGPYKSGPGSINGSVSVGGSVVRPGDVIVGDMDGVVVIPTERAAEVASTAEAIVASEQEQRLSIGAGRWDRTWLSATEIVGPDGLAIQSIATDRS